jgi:hypothetical protein
MNFYVSVPVERVDEYDVLVHALEAAGHTNTYNWARHFDLLPSKKAAADVLGIQRAGMLIALLPGGRSFHVEIGVALGCDIPVFIIGPTGDATGKDCVFYSHPWVTRYDELSDFMEDHVR